MRPTKQGPQPANVLTEKLQTLLVQELKDARAKAEALAERLLASETARASAEGRLKAIEDRMTDLVTANKKLEDKCFIGMGFSPLWEVRVPVGEPATDPGGPAEPIKVQTNMRDWTATIQKMEDKAAQQDTLEIRQAIIRDMDAKEATTNGRK